MKKLQTVGIQVPRNTVTSGEGSMRAECRTNKGVQVGMTSKLLLRSTHRFTEKKEIA
jgi:hypothetical protein